MKRTPLYENHKKLDARMVDFGDWEMPIQYSGILKEHKAVRSGAGIFDTSHMGEITISGKSSLDLVQKLTTNDASKLEKHEAQYSMMCHKTGGVVDDLYVYRTENEYYLFVVNASNTKKDLKHINRIAKKFPDVKVEDISKKVIMLALQGPESENMLNRLNEQIPKRKNTYTHQEFGMKIIARTGYTGEDGFELFFNSRLFAEAAWERLIEEGAVPCGLGARDTLRLEMGYPLYGNELNDERTPLEAGLEKFVCFKKDFLGKEALLKDLERKLVGFELIDKGIARQHHKIIKMEKLWHFYCDFEVTSGTKSPTLGKSIGMGYVKPNYVKEGTELVINIRGKLAKAKVIKMPFVKK